MAKGLDKSSSPKNEVWYPLVLGDSLRSDTGTKHYTLRYDFKPASIDNTRPGSMRIGTENIVSVELSNNQAGKPRVAFVGHHEQCKDQEGIIIFDGKQFHLERLHYSIKNLKHVRNDERPLGGGAAAGLAESGSVGVAGSVRISPEKKSPPSAHPSAGDGSERAGEGGAHSTASPAGTSPASSLKVSPPPKAKAKSILGREHKEQKKRAVSPDHHAGSNKSLKRATPVSTPPSKVVKGVKGKLSAASKMGVDEEEEEEVAPPRNWAKMGPKDAEARQRSGVRERAQAEAHAESTREEPSRELRPEEVEHIDIDQGVVEVGDEEEIVEEVVEEWFSEEEEEAGQGAEAAGGTQEGEGAGGPLDGNAATAQEAAGGRSSSDSGSSSDGSSDSDGSSESGSGGEEDDDSNSESGDDL